MTTLYIMCGLPFAGKSTLVKELIKQFGFSLVATDEVNTERGIGLLGEAISRQEWEETYNIVHNRIRQVLSQGKSVIYDDCNFTKFQRNISREIAQKHQAQAKVIYVNTSIEEVAERWQQNRKTNQRFDIRDADFAQVADNFQAPTQDEDILVYDNSLHVRLWISQNLMIL